jgi:biotin carboxyl carrier protein
MKRFKFKINGNLYEVEILNVDGNIAEVEVNGSIYKVEIDREFLPTKTPKLVRPATAPSTDTPKSTDHEPIPDPNSSVAKKILSPLPGIIIDVFVKKGDKVKVGQKLLILEAMKMENNIESDVEGTVAEVKVSKGDSVMQGDVLIIVV